MWKARPHRARPRVVGWQQLTPACTSSASSRQQGYDRQGVTYSPSHDLFDCDVEIDGSDHEVSLFVGGLGAKRRLDIIKSACQEHPDGFAAHAWRGVHVNDGVPGACCQPDLLN